MVSAPSVRRARRQEERAQRRAQARARRRGPAPIVLLLAALALAGLLAGGVWAVRAWFADPLARGRAALASGDYRAARVDLLTVLADDPTNRTARFDLARALNELGRGREAERQLQRLAEQGVPAPQLVAERARAALVDGRPEAALALLAQPAAPAQRERALGVAAEAQVRLGRIDLARVAFARALQAGGSAQSWIAYARFRLAEQDMTGADSAADEARRRAPRSVAAWAVKADVVRTRAGPVAALPWYQAALERDRDDVPTLVAYGAALGEAGRYGAMLDSVNHAAELDPGNGGALFLQAVIAARGGEPALARALLRRIPAPDADLPAVLLVRAAVELMNDAPTAARDTAAALLARQPQNRAARRLLALALIRSDDFRGTIDVVDPITTSADADSWTLLLLSRAFAGMGWQGDAIQPLDRASRLAPGAPAALRDGVAGADSLDPALAVPAIRARIGAGDAAAAVALAGRLASANPGVAQAAELLGDARMAAGDGAGAIAAYRQAAGLRFDEPVALRLIAALARQGDRPAMREVLDAFAARWPENMAAMRVTASVAAEDGDWPRAAASLRALIDRIGPNDALAQAQLARALIETGDSDAALPHARRAYRLLPGNATISGVYGLALHRAGGHAQDARDLLAKAVQLSPGDAVLRGWAREVMGR
jgi:tetratricopeptide (TPR) repeat protein